MSNHVAHQRQCARLCRWICKYLEGGRIKHVGQRTHIRISIISANQWAVLADDSGATPTAEER